MTESSNRHQAILDLEARHAELLDLLAELEKRVAGVLADWQRARPDTATDNAPPTDSEAPRPAKVAA